MRESTSCQDTGRRTSHLPCLSWPSCLHQSDVNESMRTDSLGCVSMKQSVRVSSGFCCLSQLIVCNVTSTAISRLRSCLVEALCFKLIPTDFPYGLSLRGREKSTTKNVLSVHYSTMWNSELVVGCTETSHREHRELRPFITVPVHSGLSAETTFMECKFHWISYTYHDSK